LLFGSEFPSSRPPEDSHLLVTSRFGFPYRFPSFVHHARRFAPCPAHVAPTSRRRWCRYDWPREATWVTTSISTSSASPTLPFRGVTSMTARGNVDSPDSATDVTTMKEYPPLYEVLAEWDELHEATLAHLAEMSAAEFDAESPARFPTDDRSILGGIAFLAFHEAYHVGQMGLVRKYFGFDPVVRP